MFLLHAMLLKEAPFKPYYEEAGIAIYHGDAREVLLYVKPQSIDLVITDPPWGVAYDGDDSNFNAEEKSAKRIIGDHSTDLYKALNLLDVRCKRTCAMYLFYAAGDAAVVAAVVAAGFDIRSQLIWNKNHAILLLSPERRGSTVVRSIE
jgi:DNA modification methylase